MNFSESSKTDLSIYNNLKHSDKDVLLNDERIEKKLPRDPTNVSRS